MEAWLGSEGTTTILFVVVCCVTILPISLSRLWSKRCDEETRLRCRWKNDFEVRAGDKYGYRTSSKGYIDDWRKSEFPGLVAPLGKKKIVSSDSVVYLDYAGAALPSKSQMQSILHASHQVLANPHSTGPAAYKSAVIIEEAKQRIAHHFHCAPGRFAGLASPPSDCDPRDLHPGYEIVFTSGATDSMRIVSERFPWKNCAKCSQQATLVFPRSTHTSVVGMRVPATSRGAKFLSRPTNELCELDSEGLHRLLGDADQKTRCRCQETKHLIVLSAECNFGGNRPKIDKTLKSCRRSPDWFSMVDLAKAACTTEVNLKELDPDFACLSFYKMFGEPTGLGALFVRRSGTDCLLQTSRHQYFGGGSVDAVLPSVDFRVPKSEGLSSLSNGTVHFRGIAALRCGFEELRRLGGMESIARHTSCLAKELAQRLQGLRHANGSIAAEMYGAWGCSDSVSPRGPTVAFNIRRSDGSYVGYNEVTKLAALHEPPIQLRSGCFCNPGACQEALGLQDKDIIQNFEEAGHVCGDHIDIVNGNPTGAIRASLGKDSIWEDVDTLIRFLETTFVNRAPLIQSTSITTFRPARVAIRELYIYPIKSCSAQRVRVWQVLPECGRLAFDREFALVDSLGHVMRLQKHPKMTQIVPRINTEQNIMTVSAPGQPPLEIALMSNLSSNENNIVKVCGNRCGGRVWGDSFVADWFSNFLGVPCWLARHVDGRYQVAGAGVQVKRPQEIAFANEEALLLISQQAVDRINRVMVSQGRPKVHSRFFRPNLVVSTPKGSLEEQAAAADHPEDNWKSLTIDRTQLKLQNVGECARCAMVDFDPSTGAKGRTLGALAEYRRRSGQITFGVFVRRVADPIQDDSINVQEGDAVHCHYDR